ncbi:helix-turn-helix domain-containing protein (plasmid) [Gemmobacter fulvus]|uniref:Helix-turn-helix domain-containing protein n=1 Tax=Gemmobacter fulvus TaxID=2840474 RepID=A0A975S401_9RHOB|nr:helix-turn-helix domain-containing protein [Gemmobacter fulvus]MBT9246380.1 helix-turn-helix domain-containing protein [Gemmobacter fulvus]MDQ1849820.1 helix-turn-helix domain-containing protein [Gemmobacter fulvus]QWK92750.1 helix-turn-helix domain-containing protein [Gemmobacter fulvus]
MEHASFRNSVRTNVIHKRDLHTEASSIMFRTSRILDLCGDNGCLRTDLLSVNDQGFSIGRVMSGGHEVWLHEDANFTFLLPLAGRLEVGLGRQGHRIDVGQFAMLRPTERQTRAVSDRTGRFQAVTLQVSANRLQMQAALQGLRNADFAVLTMPVARYLAQSLPVLMVDTCGKSIRALPLRVAAELGTLIDELLSETLGTPLATSSTRRILPDWHRVCQAEEIMRARCDEALSMPDLAASVGVSLRSLQLGFQEVYGLPPRAVLSRIRLDLARVRLLAARPGETVTSIALETGFIHLSRFAQLYARTFGETPRETLGRCRA